MCRANCFVVAGWKSAESQMELLIASANSNLDYITLENKSSKLAKTASQLNFIDKTIGPTNERKYRCDKVPRAMVPNDPYHRP